MTVVFARRWYIPVVSEGLRLAFDGRNSCESGAVGSVFRMEGILLQVGRRIAFGPWTRKDCYLKA